VSPSHRFYLIGQSFIGAAIANAVINAGLGWAAVRGVPTFPVWRVPGVAADLAGTAFGVTFGTCLVMAFTVPRDVGHGKIAPFELPPGVASLVAMFPRKTFSRAMGLGFLSIAFALPVIATLAGLGLDLMQSKDYVVLKAAFAAVQGALVTPLIVIRVLADLPQSRSAESA
jgi:hypothetical protein